jgi:hypothetical protein
MGALQRVMRDKLVVTSVILYFGLMINIRQYYATTPGGNGRRSVSRSRRAECH